MKNALTYILLSSLLSAGAQNATKVVDLKSELLAVSTRTFTAFQHKDAREMKALLASDFLYIGKEGALTLPQLGEATAACQLTRFELLNPEVRILGQDTAVLSYTAKQDEQCHGVTQPSNLLSADVYIRTPIGWRIQTHMEVAPE